MPPALLFDLDGTLVDSIELILNSARHAFIDFVGVAPTDNEWRATIGRPLHTVLSEFAAGNAAESARLLARYRDYQLENHDRLLHAYTGIVPALRAFAAAGHQQAIVTSKADWLARKALELIGVDDLFPVLVGCDSSTRFKPDPEPVELALGLLRSSPDDAIFIGDSPHDIHAGTAAGVYTIGVTWGACTRQEMERAGASVVIDNVGDLQGAVADFSTFRDPLQTF